MKLVISERLPGLNDYIGAERISRYQGAELKKDTEEKIMWYITSSRLTPIKKAVAMNYTWYEKNRRRDKDNISSFGRKVIQDALVKAKILKDDGWDQIERFSDAFKVDKDNPRVEVEIVEVDHG